MGSRGFRDRSVWGDGRLRVVLVLALASAGFGCGREQGESARVASMLSTPTSVGESEAEGGGMSPSGPRAVEAIEIVPKRPVAGARLSARARFAQGSGARPEVTYQWRTGSGRMLTEGPELDTSGLEPGTTIEVVATPIEGGDAGEIFAHRFRLTDPAKQIALVVIDARDGKSVGSVLRAVVETTDEQDGFDVASVEWRVAGERVGEDEELDTARFAPGDVVELRARLAGEGERPILAEPIVLERSAPPEIRSTPSVGIEGGLFRYAIEASSPARGATLRYELMKGPEGMKVDAATGVLEWRPAASQRGRFDVEVAVMDQWGSGVAQRFGIHADPRSAPPASPR